MKMNKIIALLLALMLAFTLTVAFTACGEDEPVVDEPTDDPTTDVPTDDPTDDPTNEDPTDDPTTEDPTDDPTTEDPTTEDPTDDPTTEDPTDDPTPDDPTPDDPTPDDPTPDDPTPDDPTPDDPTPDDPTPDDPTPDDPTPDDPTPDDPTPDDPTPDEPTPDEPTPDEPTNDDVNRDVVLLEKGKAYFNFVVADGYTSDVNRTVDTLISDLAKLGVATKRVFDNKDTITACEVLVGTVQTRGEQYMLDHHVYGYEGFAIKVIDGRVIILGGSEEALIDAVAEFKKTILGIKKTTKVLTDVTMTAEQNIEQIQDDYDIQSVTVAGNDLRDYVIVARSSVSAEITAARAVQDLLYKKIGMWLPIVNEEGEYDKVIFLNLSTPKTCSSDKGFILQIKEGDIRVDCGFANKIEEATLAFFITEITNSNDPNPSFNNNFKYEKVDYKNLYYKDFGAEGDGYTDDFFALMACHDQANAYGHTVNAESGATYYLGEGSGYSSITVQTDTNWNGCKFIFDDSTIAAPECDPATGKQISGSMGDPEYYTPIFSISNSKSTVHYGASNTPIKSLYEGATNIGFAPGYEAIIKPYNSNIYHFIRWGLNQNSGSAQNEVIHVDAEGNIDPMTPVQWNYDVITKLSIVNAEEEPITINGGDNRQTHVETKFNGAPSFYTYYKRNIQITRSNVTIKNIRHTIIEEGETGAPYTGFIYIADANNVNVDGCEFQCPKGYRTIGSAGESVGMGTYEICAATSTNILWSNCTQSNLYKEDGSMQSDGMMGTNYCKNLMFDNMVVCSFDAHCGTYNASLRNSTCEHLNFIGEGTIILENMNILANPAGNAIVLRSDYGSTWQGDLIIKGLNMKYYSRTSFSVVNAQWVNHFFGYQTYLPENIYLEDFKLTKVGWEVNPATGQRIEWEIPTDTMLPINLYTNLNGYIGTDISDPDADMTAYPTDDPVSCTCADGFNDTTGDGLCDNKKCGLPKEGKANVNKNPVIVTKNVYIKNCPGLTLVMPKTPAFKETKVYVWDDTVGEAGDYIESFWWESGKISVPAE